MTLAGLVVALAAEPAPPAAAATPAVEAPMTEARAEARRLVDELAQHAKASRHAAVDRTYAALLAVGEPVDAAVHVEAGRAALALGRAGLAVARFYRGGDARAAEDVAARYGSARISAPAGAALSGHDPFAPDERAAVAAVNEQLRADGRFVGLLPAGTYTLAGRSLVIAAGAGGGVIAE